MSAHAGICALGFRCLQEIGNHLGGAPGSHVIRLKLLVQVEEVYRILCIGIDSEIYEDLSTY